AFLESDPVTPSGVPPFDEHAADVVRGGEVDVALGVLCRCAVTPTLDVPGGSADVHFPPDADVLHRLEPTHVTERVRLVEIEDEFRFDQSAGVRADLDRSPRRLEGQAAFRGIAEAIGRAQCA